MYRLSGQEQALIAVNRAADLAWAQLGRMLAFRTQAGESLEGAIPDISLEGIRKRADAGIQILELLAAVDDEALPHGQALTAKLLRYYGEAWSKEAERYWVAIDVAGFLFYGPFAQTSYTGGLYFGYLNKALAEYRFAREADCDRYLGSISDVARLLWQIHARTEGQAERGIRIHQPQLPAVRAMLSSLRGQAASAYLVDAARLGAIADGAAFAAQVTARVEQRVLPAFDALIAQLDADYERQAPQGVGMSQLPGGREVYADLVRLHTTRELTPEQVHAAGHARMARIEAEMEQIRGRLGFGGSAAEFAQHLRQQPGAAARSAEEIGEKMRRHKDRVDQRFDEFFARRSASDYDLVRLPAALEGSLTWGYYQEPDGEERRGLYHYNGSRLDSLAVLAAASLVFHELVPGHHLHTTLQRDNDNLHPVRKSAYVNAFNEGWAEYAATLTGEMGLYDDPYDRYGRLCMDAFLTCRLVVDTGMNALDWSWERAKDYLREHSLCAEGEIASDTLRYSCSIPAQALAYKLGDEEILRMREKARQRAGERFRLRDFHSAILDVGGLPLPALEWHLDKVFGAA